LSYGVVVFGSLRVKKDLMAAEMHDIERLETAIVLDVSWPKEVRLMDVVEPQGLGEIGVYNPFGGIQSFFD
jgi:hypothetical protein